METFKIACSAMRTQIKSLQYKFYDKLDHVMLIANQTDSIYSFRQHNLATINGIKSHYQ